MLTQALYIVNKIDPSLEYYNDAIIIEINAVMIFTFFAIIGVFLLILYKNYKESKRLDDIINWINKYNANIARSIKLNDKGD